MLWTRAARAQNSSIRFRPRLEPLEDRTMLAWSIVASPSPGTKLNLLTGVSCTSATSCTAAGHRDYQSLVERYA